MSRHAQEKSITGPVLVAVDRCIQICAAREEACTLASREVSDRALKELLGDLAEERGMQAIALRAVVEPFGGGNPSGIRMRNWRESRGRSDQSVLDDCIDGEIRSLTDFEVVFTWAPLAAMPMEVRALMLSAYGATLRSLSELRRRIAA
jgi:hypothetical protein